ncbi:unnamed protein product [Strongylus vulgaris]|uniref:Uncharacterized protein n=1 Tax=Strongylus vulgaris TaxID=40348 RepID=A0A3P7KVJ0_STRVU|nr:unnamed protein product [Strongylus vulgaris]
MRSLYVLLLVAVCIATVAAQWGNGPYYGGGMRGPYGGRGMYGRQAYGMRSPYGGGMNPMQGAMMGAMMGMMRG